MIAMLFFKALAKLVDGGVRFRMVGTTYFSPKNMSISLMSKESFSLLKNMAWKTRNR